MPKTRLWLILGATAVLAVVAAFYTAPRTDTQTSTIPASATATSDDAALDNHQLAEITLGADSAPITIIEYASMTCNFCAAFHIETLPQLKEKYIDAGLVQIKMRPFPLDPYAMTGAVLSYCVAPTQRANFVNLLLVRQQQWVASSDPLNVLQGLARQAGLSEADFVLCLKDERILQGIRAIQKTAAKDLKVTSTPTFFVNGRKVEGNMSFTEFEKILIPLLPENEGGAS